MSPCFNPVLLKLQTAEEQKSHREEQKKVDVFTAHSALSIFSGFATSLSLPSFFFCWQKITKRLVVSWRDTANAVRDPSAADAVKGKSTPAVDICSVFLLRRVDI